MKRVLYICVFVLISGIFLTGCGRGSYLSDSSEVIVSDDEMTDQDDLDVSESSDERMESGVFVHVCGAVLHPGVYELPDGSRVYQAIDAAGGLLDDADDTSVNQATLLSDGDMIVIPFEGETPSAVFSQGSVGQDAQGRVNINQADSELLQTLPGIGKARAEAIIAYRDAHGMFSDIEGLRQVDGIGDGIFSGIADHICV